MILNLKNFPISKKIYLIIFIGLAGLVIVSVFSFYLVRAQNAATLMVMCERRYIIELHLAEENFEQYVRTGKTAYKTEFNKNINISNKYAEFYGKIDIYIKTRPKQELVEEAFGIYKELINKKNTEILIDSTRLLLFFDIQLVKDLIRNPRNAFQLGLKVQSAVNNFMHLPEVERTREYREISASFKKLNEYGNHFSKNVSDLLMFVQKISLIALISFSLLTIIFCFIFTLHVTRSITVPIPELMAGINRIKEGNFIFKVNINSEDEFGTIAKCFNDMVTALNENQQTIGQAYEELKSSAEWLRALFDTATRAGIGIIVIDAGGDHAGTIQSINPAVSQIIGYEEDNIIGKNVLQFFHPESHEEILKSYSSLKMKQKDLPQKQVYKAVGIDQQIIHLEISAVSTEVKNKPVIVAYTTDISDRIAAEKELADVSGKLVESAHKAGMADIATGILHNVGNILASVLVSTQVINEMITNSKIIKFKRANTILRENSKNLDQFILENPKCKKLLVYYLEIENGIDKEIEAFRHHLLRLNEKVNVIRDVISAQQNYAGTASLALKMSVNDIIEEALAMLMETKEFQNIRVIKKMNKIPDITVQKTKLVHVLINLFKNAIDAMFELPTENKILTISTELIENNVFIKVSDVGHGIKETDLEKIFAHGFSTKPNGFGFGLHSTANYMTEMGGSIKAESEGKNKGATFVLKFPLR